MGLTKYLFGFVGLVALALASTAADAQVKVKLEPFVTGITSNYAALLRETARADEAERLEARAKAIRAKTE